MEKYIDEVIKMANKAKKQKEVPVGALIILNNKIIAKAYNLKNKTQIATKHAEIIAIEKANRKIKSWRLDECVMIVTLEPCMMCAGAILESRIKKIYCLSKRKNECSIEWLCKNGVEVEFVENNIKSLMILRSFFEKKR